MKRIDLKKLQKERALLNAAFALFLKNGIKNTSISDITTKAGVAKGTFYLYFQDKYDIRDRIVTSKSAEVFTNAYRDLMKSNLMNADIKDKVLFLLGNCADQLTKNQQLLCFIATNMEWGILHNAAVKPDDGDEISVREAYTAIYEELRKNYRDVEIMFFMIIELTVATCYNAIIHQSPAPVEVMQPEVFKTINVIMDSYRIDQKNDEK